MRPFRKELYGPHEVTQRLLWVKWILHFDCYPLLGRPADHSLQRNNRHKRRAIIQALSTQCCQWEREMMVRGPFITHINIEMFKAPKVYYISLIYHGRAENRKQTIVSIDRSLLWLLQRAVSRQWSREFSHLHWLFFYSGFGQDRFLWVQSCNQS